MINRESMERQLRPLEPGKLYFPDYDGFCFSGIPGTIERLLCGSSARPQLPPSVLSYSKRPRVVVLILFDAFGWHSYSGFGHDFREVQELEARGTLSKLTSQFPSTTAAHVSTLFSGEPVCDHGIYEWFMYEPLVDRVIAPLPFMLAGDRRPDSLKELGVSAAEIFRAPSFAETLKVWDIEPVIFQDTKYALSSYSQQMLRGGEIVPYASVEAGLDALASRIDKSDRPSFFYFYIDRYDTAGHETGPFSERSQSEAHRMFRLLAERLYPVLDRSANLTLLLTADHGQCTVSPDRVFYVNEELPELVSLMQRNRAGELIPFAGSSRDLFLHIRPEYLDRALEMLRNALAGRALVQATEKLAELGLFCGKELSPALASRIGNLVILPYEGDQVYYHEAGRFEALFRGHHGGLALAEIETPLFAVET